MVLFVREGEEAYSQETPPPQETAALSTMVLLNRAGEDSS